MLEFGSNSSFLPDWTTLQWIAAGGIVVLIGSAVLVIYAIFFALPGGILFIPEGEDVMEFWREVMDERAERRGRITRPMIFVGFGAVALIGLALLLRSWAFTT